VEINLPRITVLFYLGLDLNQYQVDPKDIRRKLLTITPKGVEVVKDLTDYVLKKVASINNN
jgi:DNA-binding MarR family transcriptional regulator